MLLIMDTPYSDVCTSDLVSTKRLVSRLHSFDDKLYVVFILFIVGEFGRNISTYQKETFDNLQITFDRNFVRLLTSCFCLMENVKYF